MQDPLQPPALSEYEPEAKYELSTAAPALIGNRGSKELGLDLVPEIISLKPYQFDRLV